MFKKLIICLILTIKLINCAFPEFRLYTPTNKNDFTLVDANNLRSSPFSAARKSFFVIHGFNGNADNDWVIQIKDNFLLKENANIFTVQWAEGASGLDYAKALTNAKAVGTALGNFVVDTGISASNIHCVGHSLGAHACGFAGKVRRLGRISGLDPAGPGFKGQPSKDRLDKTDADYVDVIHTDALLGIQDPIGHKDFYPNGGQNQAGCFAIGKRSLDVEDVLRADPKIFNVLACSHQRVPILFAESITTNCKFEAVPCASYDAYQKGQCKCDATVGCSSMGYKSAPNSEQGKFYLKTNSKNPFCLA